jgi:hypothetical protein
MRLKGMRLNVSEALGSARQFNTDRETSSEAGYEVGDAENFANRVAVCGESASGEFMLSSC